MWTHAHKMRGSYRRWLHFSGPDMKNIGLEVSYGRKRFKALGIDFTVGGGDCRTFGAMLGLYVICIFISFNGFHTIRRAKHPLDYGREFGLYWSFGELFGLTVKFLALEMEWSRDWRRTGINLTWNPIDALFGRLRHRVDSKEALIKTQVLVPARHGYDEAAHKVEVVMSDESWKRPRLPWVSSRIRRAHIECLDPIPHPGKGTTGYNCDEDALHALTCPANTVHDGLAALVNSAMSCRRRYPL